MDDVFTLAPSIMAPTLKRIPLADKKNCPAFDGGYTHTSKLPELRSEARLGLYMAQSNPGDQAPPHATRNAALAQVDPNAL